MKVVLNMANKKIKFTQLSIPELYKKFNREDKCRNFLFAFKWHNGYICPDCGHREFSFITTRHLYQCKLCLKQASISTGTIMQDTKLSLFTWILGLYLLATRKDGISAESLAEQLGISTKAARLMSRKIKFAMSERNSLYQLAETIEMDGTYVGAPTRNGKRGLGTEKVPVLVSLSLINGIYPQYLKLHTMNSECEAEIREFMKNNINKDKLTKVISDGKASYNFIEREYSDCSLENLNFDAENNPKHLKWLHTITSNFKTFLLGNYHGIDRRYLQFAAAEFEWRFNRRNRGTLMINSIANTMMTCKVMTRRMLQDIFVTYNASQMLSNATGS